MKTLHFWGVSVEMRGLVRVAEETDFGAQLVFEFIGGKVAGEGASAHLAQEFLCVGIVMDIGEEEDFIVEEGILSFDVCVEFESLLGILVEVAQDEIDIAVGFEDIGGFGERSCDKERVRGGEISA